MRLEIGIPVSMTGFESGDNTYVNLIKIETDKIEMVIPDGGLYKVCFVSDRILWLVEDPFAKEERYLDLYTNK